MDIGDFKLIVYSLQETDNCPYLAGEAHQRASQDGSGGRGGRMGVLPHNKCNRLTMKASKPQTYVDLMSDAGFKAVFADRQNKDLLIFLINSLLPAEAKVSDIVAYLDREQHIDTIFGKKTILDLVCQDEQGRTFSVEVQRVGTGTFFERCVFYASGLFHDELVAAEDYGLLKPVYLIAIMEESLPHEDEKLWNDGRFISEYAFTEKNTGELAPPTINIIFAELGRFRKDARECASEQDWLFFWFKHGWEYDSLPSNMDSRPFITGLADACAIAGFTPEKKQYYRALMKDQRDYNSIINQKFREGMEEGEIKGKAEGLAEGMMKGKAEGLAEGKAEGLAEGKAESARNIALEMLDRGMDPKLVAEITNLDISEIEKLKR